MFGLVRKMLSHPRTYEPGLETKLTRGNSMKPIDRKKTALRVLAAAVALVVIGLVAAPAQAASFSFRYSYTGPVTIHISDWTTVSFYPNTTSCTGAVACEAAQVGGPSNPKSAQEDEWGVFRIDQMLALQATPGHPSGSILWSNGDAGAELTGIFRGIQDLSVQLSGGSGTIDAGQSDIGARAVVYLNDAGTFDASGPQTANRTGIDTFTGISGGSFFLGVDFASGVNPANPAIFFHDIVNTNSPFVSNATAYGNVNGGSAHVAFDSNSQPTAFGPRDLKFVINEDAGQLALLFPASNFDTFSSDPISAAVVVPAPLTLTLLGVSLVGLSGLGWLRKRRA
jgi:hypothetical protein